MDVYVQWSLSEARGWDRYDSSEFATLPRKRLPTGGERTDLSEGWITALCVQGVVFTGDHYAIRHYPNDPYIDVWGWTDDLDDYPAEMLETRCIRFYPPALEDRAYHGGVDRIWNTRQSQIVYGASGILAKLESFGPIQNTILQPYVDFVPPDSDIIRHGVWLPNTLNAAHEQERRVGPSWMSYIPDYRPPLFRQNTISYLFNAPNTTDGDCTPAVDHNNRMDESGQTTETLAANLGGGVDKITHAFTTESGDPGVVDWPVASGGDPYRCSFNIVSIGANVTCGLLTLGSASGEFVRVNSSCTRQEGWVQEEGAFSTTGVAVANHTTINPASGASGDRYQVRIAGSRTANHGNQPLDIDTDSNSFAQGPWAASVVASRPRITNVNRAVQRASIF